MQDISFDPAAAVVLVVSGRPELAPVGKCQTVERRGCPECANCWPPTVAATS
jgi:hypothetical protein